MNSIQCIRVNKNWGKYIKKSLRLIKTKVIKHFLPFLEIFYITYYREIMWVITLPVGQFTTEISRSESHHPPLISLTGHSLQDIVDRFLLLKQFFLTPLLSPALSLSWFLMCFVSLVGICNKSHNASILFSKNILLTFMVRHLAMLKNSCWFVL